MIVDSDCPHDGWWSTWIHKVPTYIVVLAFSFDRVIVTTRWAGCWGDKLSFFLSCLSFQFCFWLLNQWRWWMKTVKNHFLCIQVFKIKVSTNYQFADLFQFRIIREWNLGPKFSCKNRPAPETMQTITSRVLLLLLFLHY